MQIKYVQLRREFLIGRQNILQGQSFYNLLGRKIEEEEEGATSVYLFTPVKEEVLKDKFKNWPVE